MRMQYIVVNNNRFLSKLHQRSTKSKNTRLTRVQYTDSITELIIISTDINNCDDPGDNNCNDTSMCVETTCGFECILSEGIYTQLFC